MVKVVTVDGKSVQAEVITREKLIGVIERRKSPRGMGKFVQNIPATDPDYNVRSITILDQRTGKCVTAAFDKLGNLVADSAGLVKYSQQSMSKPVAEALTKNLMGIKAFKDAVGSDASGRPYDSNVTYPDQPGVPYNGNVNIGALRVWDLLISEAKKRGEDPIKMYMDFMRKMSNNDTLEINETMAQGEFSHRPSNNIALLEELKKHDKLENSFEEVYLAYCRACAVMINTEDSARIRSKFATGKDPVSGEELLKPEVADHMRGAMTVSGMYDESGHDFVNFHAQGAKSGVDGGIMFALPSKIPGNPDLIVAVHHAGLNPRGNSAEGRKWMKDLDKTPLIFADDPLLKQPGRIVNEAIDTIGKSIRQLFGFGAASTPETIEIISQEEIDLELQRAMTDGGIDRLEARVKEECKKLDEKLKAMEGNYKGGVYGGIYLKPAKDGNVPRNGRFLFEETDRNGNMKQYYHVPDRHHLEKVVVIDVDPPATSTPETSPPIQST